MDLGAQTLDFSRSPSDSSDAGWRARLPELFESTVTSMPLKRLLDIVLGSVLAAAAIVPVCVLALLLAIELRGWPFFVQQRVGRNGVLFSMPKLRTLPADVDPYGSRNAFGAERLSRLRRFLRHTHLDELPQLFLVPLGTMSLVGPRPKMPDWAEPIDPTYAWLRTRVAPGCTGLWQIGRDNPGEKVSEYPRYDYFYLRHGGITLDLWVLWRTVLLLTGFESQVLLADVPLSVRGTGFGVQPTVLGASRVEVLDLGPARPLELVAVASLRAGS